MWNIIYVLIESHLSRLFAIKSCAKQFIDPKALPSVITDTEWTMAREDENLEYLSAMATMWIDLCSTPKQVQ